MTLVSLTLSFGYTEDNTSEMTQILSENVKNEAWLTLASNEYNIPYIILSKQPLESIQFDINDGRILIDGQPAKPYEYNFGYLLNELFRIGTTELGTVLNEKVGELRPLIYVYWK